MINLFVTRLPSYATALDLQGFVPWALLRLRNNKMVWIIAGMQSRISLKCTSSLYTRELQKVLEYLYKLKLYHLSSPLISFCEEISIKTNERGGYTVIVCPRWNGINPAHTLQPILPRFTRKFSKLCPLVSSCLTVCNRSRTAERSVTKFYMGQLHK